VGEDKKAKNDYLASKEQKVQECDATEADSSNTDWFIKIKKVKFDNSLLPFRGWGLNS
jgi:hypothetical protein